MEAVIKHSRQLQQEQVRAQQAIRDRVRPTYIPVCPSLSVYLFLSLLCSLSLSMSLSFTHLLSLSHTHSHTQESEFQLNREQAESQWLAEGQQLRAQLHSSLSQSQSQSQSQSHSVPHSLVLHSEQLSGLAMQTGCNSYTQLIYYLCTSCALALHEHFPLTHHLLNAPSLLTYSFTLSLTHTLTLSPLIN